MNALSEERRYLNSAGQGQYAEESYAYPWVHMPALGEQFNIVASIECPAADGVDNTIQSFTCPVGYEGALWAVAHGYVGTGYIEASGDVLWRISINGRYPRGFDSIPLQLGSHFGPWSLPAPIRFGASETITYTVAVPNGSAVATGAGNYVFGVLAGYIWPSRRTH